MTPRPRQVAEHLSQVFGVGQTVSAFRRSFKKKHLPVDPMRPGLGGQRRLDGRVFEVLKEAEQVWWGSAT